MKLKYVVVPVSSVLACAFICVARDQTNAKPPADAGTEIGIAYKSNGKGGGDWFDPKTWEPNGVPGSERHLDAVMIQKYDVVTQSKRYPFTLGFYLLDDCATHIFQDEADLASLSVDCSIEGRWLREGDIEPLIVVRNCAEASRPSHARTLQVFDCPLYCQLLRDAPPPFDSLPPCTNQCEGDQEAAKAKAEATIKAAREANLRWTGGMRPPVQPEPNVAQLTEEDFRYIRELTSVNVCTLAEFCTLSTLDLSNSAITDDGLRHLKKHRKLHLLTLTNTAVTDAGLAHVGEIKQLGGIFLGQTKVTGAGLKYLADLNEISDLDLSNTPFNDAGTRELVLLKNLTGRWLHINLAGTDITDESAALLGKIKGLRTLNISGTAITNEAINDLRTIPDLLELDLGKTELSDAGLKVVSEFKSLGALNLDDTAITDEGIEMLAHMPNLHTLQLNGTVVTDKSVEYLLTIPKLAFLQIQGTKITADGVDRLMEAKPRIQITQ